MKFLKKSRKDSWNLAGRAIPKELPSLARDIIKRKEAEQQGYTSFSEEPVIRKKGFYNIVQSKELQEKIPSTLPDLELKKTESVEKTNKGAFQENVPKQEEFKGRSLNFESKHVNDRTFFSNILENISKETKDIERAEKFYKEGLLSQDLLSGMKKYWNDQKKNILFTSKEESLKQKLLDKINFLQEHEIKWQMHHLALIDEEEKIRTGEIELKKMLREFKELCKRHIHEKSEKPQNVTRIPPEHYFNLANGQVLKDLTELKNALKTMDENTFSHHVNENRNDFANWVKDVIKDENLAEQISHARTKEDILKLFD